MNYKKRLCTKELNVISFFPANFIFKKCSLFYNVAKYAFEH